MLFLDKKTNIYGSWSMNYCEIWHIYNMKWIVPKLKNDLEYAFVQNLLSNLAPHHPIVLKNEGQFQASRWLNISTKSQTEKHYSQVRITHVYQLFSLSYMLMFPLEKCIACIRMHVSTLC